MFHGEVNEVLGKPEDDPEPRLKFLCYTLLLPSFKVRLFEFFLRSITSSLK